MKCFKYSNRPKAYITVKLIEEPYGEDTEKVVSIGCTLKGDMQNPTWKVHIPMDLAESVGQELTRLVRLEREKSSKAISRSSLSARSFTSVTSEPNLASPPPTEEETRALSDAAVSQGRVIRRQRKKD